MSNDWESLRKWAKAAARGETDKIPYIDIVSLIDENNELRAKFESTPSSANGAEAQVILPDAFWELVADCGGMKDLGRNARLLQEWVQAYARAAVLAELKKRGIE